MTTITLNLPGHLIKRAEQASLALQKPVGDVLADLLETALPDVTDAPIEMQAELTQMSWLDNQALWAAVHRYMDVSSDTRLRVLSQRQAQHPLTTAEQSELDALRQEYGRITLLKARAYALLSLRGGQPLLKQAEN